MELSCPESVFGVPLPGKVVALGEVEPVAVDLDVLAHDEVLWLVDLPLLRLVGAPFEELTVPEAIVFGRGLVDLQAVVVEVVGEDELAVGVLRLAPALREHCVEPQADLLVHPLEEVLLGGLRHQPVYVPQRVLLRPDAVMRGNYYV